MKPLLTLITILTLAGGAAAQINHPYNEVGIYTVEQPVGVAETEIDAPANVMFDCYVVLTNPYNEALGRPITTVGGMAFSLGMPAGVYVVDTDLPPQTGWLLLPDVLWGGEFPVVASYCSLIGLTIMSTTGAADLLYLLPLQNTPQYISGQMSFADLDDDFSQHVMHPVSGSHDVPVFALNWPGEFPFGETVPARDAAFGEMKALYR
ncbi:MAG: hypothetical protein IH621_18605 [Krumholzibacteria bacterium]|nr:hypothetical protein [Candidatus Krumholzibacteria bacterium]